MTRVASFYAITPFEACVYFSQELLAVEPSVFMKQPISKAGTVYIHVATIYAGTIKAET